MQLVNPCKYYSETSKKMAAANLKKNKLNLLYFLNSRYYFVCWDFSIHCCLSISSLQMLHAMVIRYGMWVKEPWFISSSKTKTRKKKVSVYSVASYQCMWIFELFTVLKLLSLAMLSSQQLHDSPSITWLSSKMELFVFYIYSVLGLFCIRHLFALLGVDFFGYSGFPIPLHP